MNDRLPGVDDDETFEGWNWKLIAAGAVGILALIFMLQNRGRRTIHFLFFEWTTGTWFALLVTFLLGLAAGLLLAHLRVRRQERKEQ
jgi:uncharacterized integral membrane protein